MYVVLSKNNTVAWNPLSPTATFDKITPDIILANTKFDKWEAIKEPNRNQEGKAIPNSHYIKRSDNEFVLNPYVKDTYEIVQYTEGLQWLEYFLREDLLDIDTVLYIEPGTELGITCTINVEEEVLDGDKLTRFLTFCLSHSGSVRGLFYTDFRLVCENTLRMGKSLAMNEMGKSFKLDDSKPKDSLQLARNLVNLSKRNFREQAIPLYRSLHELELSFEQVDSLVKDLIKFPNTEVITESNASSKQYDTYNSLMEAVNSSPGNELLAKGFNGYKVLNGVTYAAKNLGNTSTSQYKNNIVGTGRQWRNKTLSILTAMLPKTN